MNPALEALDRGATVVTATRRLSRYLRWRHDADRLAAGTGAWAGADVLPWDAWIARQWELELLEGAPALLSASELRIVWRQVLEAEGLLSAEARVLAPQVARSWRLCEDWGIGEDRLAGHAASDESHAFGCWARAFRQRCADLGRIDLGLAADRLFAAGRFDATEVLFAGFDPWTPLHARFATALEAAGGRVGRPTRHGQPGRLQGLACEEPADELRQAAGWARALLDGNPAWRVGIVVPDLESQGAALRRAAFDALVPGWTAPPEASSPNASPVNASPLNVSLGRALGRYPVVHTALLLIATAAEEMDWRPASQLLRSPLIVGEEAGRRRADLALRRCIGRSISSAHLRELCRQHAPRLGVCLQRLHELLDATGTALPGRWARRVDEALQAAGWPGEVQAGSEAAQAAAAWQRLLQVFSSRDDLLGPLNRKAAVQALNEMAAEQPFEPAGHDGGLQVMGLLEAEGQHFDALWICGLTADEWPPPPRPDPFVPLSLQRELGLPEASAGQVRRQAERRFARLLAAAPIVVGSWPQRRGEEECLPSPWLAHAEARSRVVSVRPWRERIAASTGLEVVAGDPPPPLTGDERVVGGAALLNAQARCPARAFVQYRLRTRELPVPRPPLDALGRGKLVHRFLERLYGQPECAGNLGGLDEVGLDRAVDAVLGDILREALPGTDPARTALRLIEGDRLRSLAGVLAQLDRERGEFRVEVEQPWTMVIGGLSLSLRLDRVERHGGDGPGREGGTLLILDYKTGEFSPGGWRSRRLEECQLPLYAQAEHVGGIAVACIGPGGVELRGVVEDESLAAPGLQEAARFMREPGLRWPALVARWRGQLETLAGEYAGGDFRVNPRARDLVSGPWAPVIRAPDSVAAADDE